jgi:NAD(P)H-hydrate epimerase
MKIVTPKLMQEIDKQAQSECGIPAELLMLNAGRGLADFIQRLIGSKGFKKKIAVFAGKGNNGGDAFCMATLLPRDYTVQLFCTSPAEDLSPAARHYYQKLPDAQARIEQNLVAAESDLLARAPLLSDCSVIIDGLLGTGFKGEAEGIIRSAISFMNAQKKYVIAIDIPSGLNAETGMPAPCAVEARDTLTMALPKCGMFVNEGPDYCGRITVLDIGLPANVVDAVKSNAELLQQGDICPLLSRRKRLSHKGDYGHILVLACSYGMTGAGCMAALAALRSGSGLVTIGAPESLYNALAPHILETMVLPLPETENLSISPEALPVLEKIMAGFDAALIGPGLSRHPETVEFAQEYIKRSARPVVIDADALNAVSEDLSVLENNNPNMVLTPHIGEFSRLTGMKKEEIMRNRFTAAFDFARTHKVTLVLKGYNSIVTDGKSGIWINSTGNPGMATAGMGDVLSGTVASLLGQGLSPLHAAQAGVYIHGLAGDMIAGETGEAGMIASDIITTIPRALHATAGM